MVVPSDNSLEKNSNGSLHLTGGGVVVDIGTGDGRFVSAAARANPNKFYIGIDANVKPLEKVSMRATRKPKKGGLPNAMFVQASVDDLPDELNDTANEIHIHFPWGSLLKAVATGETEILNALRRIAAQECLLEIIIGIEIERDRHALDRLEMPELNPPYIERELIPRYVAAKFKLVEYRELDRGEWSEIETSWARRLSVSKSRRVFYLLFSAI